MENPERTDAGAQAGGTPYHEDEPIQGQGGRPGQGGEMPGKGGQPGEGEKSGEGGRIGQGGSGLEDEDDENETGSKRERDSGQGDSSQNPAMKVDASVKTPKTG